MTAVRDPAPDDALAVRDDAPRRGGLRVARQAAVPFAWGWRHASIRHLIIAVASFAALVLVTFNASFNTNTSIASSACYIAVIAGLSVLTGVSGQVSLGNGAFMAIGAYSACLWLNHHPSQPYIVALVVATAMGAILGVVVGLPATRLSGPYLAGMTLAFMLAFQQALSYPSWQNVFGGDGGVQLTNQPNPPQWLINHSQTLGVDSFGIAQGRYFAWVAGAGAIVVLVVLANLMKSRFGRQFRLVRDDDVAAELMGVRVARTRVIAFVTSAACAGLGGGLYVIVQGGVSPSPFGLVLSISLVAAMVIGGTGTLAGAIWGGIVLGFSGEWIGKVSSWLNVNQGSNVGANLEALIFGAALLVLILVFPGGMQRLLQLLARGARRAVVGGTERMRRHDVDAPGRPTTG